MILNQLLPAVTGDAPGTNPGGAPAGGTCAAQALCARIWATAQSAAGTVPCHLASPRPGRAGAHPPFSLPAGHSWLAGKMWDATTRKPMFLLLLFGLFLLRYAQRAFLLLLFHEPPRTQPPGPT